MGDRKLPQAGDTEPIHPGVITFTNWEVAPPTCCEKFCLLLRCSWTDNTRSYIYSRDNRSIERNDTNGKRNCCTWCCKIQDDVKVSYYDRKPFKKECRCAPCCAWFCCMFYYCDEPKLDVVDDGFLCCCTKISCENFAAAAKRSSSCPSSSSRHHAAAARTAPAGVTIAADAVAGPAATRASSTRGRRTPRIRSRSSPHMSPSRMAWVSRSTPSPLARG